MGMTIVVDERAPIPRPVKLELVCDGTHQGAQGTLFALEVEAWTFNHGDYVKNHHAAMKAGWKETYSARGVRIWLCPACSGKEAT